MTPSPADHAAPAAPAWVVTGPTSGFGHGAALELATRGTVILVGRDPDKLSAVVHEIADRGGHALAVRADMSDVVSVRDAAREILSFGLPIAGVLNNAGISPGRPGTSAQGWDLAFATNHLGPLAFTDALLPGLADGTTVVFVVSAVEDPARVIARRAGYRGSRFISVEATARGEYEPGGSRMPGFDAYATTKQGGLAAAFSLAREYPRLRFRAIEPGVNPGSNLSRDAGAAAAIGKVLAPVLSLLPHFTTTRRAAKVIVGILTDPSDATGTYYDEDGHLMRASVQVSDPEFADRYLADSRTLIAGAD